MANIRGSSCWTGLLRWLKPQGGQSVDLGPATLILAIALYAAMYFAIGDALILGSNWFALFSLWFAALVAAEVASWIRFPRAPAMVLAGLALAQIPNSATLRLPGTWVAVIRSLALAVALLRGGLELEFHTIWRLKVPASAYTVVPMAGVVLSLMGIALALVGMPVMLGISFGFIMNAVSPGIIVAQMLSLASNGYGITHDVSIIAMLASILDEVGNLTGFAIFNNIALPSGEASLAWTILKGPTEVVIGAAGGVVLGFVCGCSRIWNSNTKRCCVVLVSVGLLMVVLADERVEMMTGGAIGALVIGLIAPMCWERGWPKYLSNGRHEHYAESVEHVTAVLWSWVFEPLLFGTIAYDVVFSQIEGSTVAMAVAFIFIGQAIRFVLAGGVMLALRFTWREALFFAVTWMPKGTVQAALGSIPLNTAKHIEHLGDSQTQYVAWGHLIKASAALSVAIFAALGTMGIEKLAPVLLPKEKTTTQQLEEELNILEDDMPELRQRSALLPATGKDPDTAAVHDQIIAKASRDPATLRRLGTLQKLSKMHSVQLLPDQPDQTLLQLDRMDENADAPGTVPAAARMVTASSGLTSVPEGQLAQLVVQHPKLLKEYMVAVEELLELFSLADSDKLARAGVSHGQQLAYKIEALQKTLAAPSAVTSRQMMRQFNELKDLQELRHQVTLTKCTSAVSAAAAAAAAAADVADVEVGGNNTGRGASRTSSLPVRF